MSEQEFRKKRFRPFEHMQYISPRVKNIDGLDGSIVDCILLGMDCDNSLFKLIPMTDGVYEEKEFWARCEYVDRPRPKPKKT